MRHTIIVATLSSVFASVLTTAVIGGSFFGANTANSATLPATNAGDAWSAQAYETSSTDLNWRLFVRVICANVAE